MAFDVSTAKPVSSSKFDISTAKPVEESNQPKKKKNFFEVIGMGKQEPGDFNVPEDVRKQKLFSPDRMKYAKGQAKQISQDIVALPTDYINQRLLNYPRAILNKENIEWPEAQDPNVRNLQKVGGVVGALQGGAGLTKAFGLGKTGDTVGKTMLKAGALSATYADTEKPFDPMQKAIQFGLGAASAGMFKLAEGATKSINKATKGASEFLRKVRGSVFSRKREIVDKFGADLDNLANAKPEQMVSIKNSLEKLSAEINGGTFGEVVIPPNPKIASIVKRSPTLNKFINNPEIADNISLRDSQAIINELRNKLPAIKKQGFNVNSDDIPLFDLIDDIRYDQLTAFPEMQQVRQSYAKMISNYNLIKYKIREGSLKRQLINDFGDPEMKEAFDSLISKDVMKEVKNFKRTHQMLKILGIAAKTGAVAGVGGAAAKVGYDLRN